MEYYLVSATPPTVFGESFWNFTVVFRMVWRYAYCFLRILKLFFLHFNLDIFSSLYATDMYREYMPCIGNPAYSFRPILLKLYRYFAAFLWFRMRNLSLAGYNCSGGASCMACSFISIIFVNFYSSSRSISKSDSSGIKCKVIWYMSCWFNKHLTSFDWHIFTSQTKFSTIILIVHFAHKKIPTYQPTSWSPESAVANKQFIKGGLMKLFRVL